MCLVADGGGLVVAPLPRGAGSVTTLVRADGDLARLHRRAKVSRPEPTSRSRYCDRAPRSARAIVGTGDRPQPLFAELEDAADAAARSCVSPISGSADLDAVEPLAAGESHCAPVRGVAKACGVPSAVRAMLAERVAGVAAATSFAATSAEPVLLA